MIRKIFRWIGIFCGVGLLLGLALLGVVYWKTEAARNRQFKVEVSEFSIPRDSATLAQGWHLANIKGCTECHGPDMGGKLMLDDPMLGLLAASNITKGTGGLPKDYSTKDWIRALKHGVRQNSTPLLFMPSHETALLSETDMAALIAYCQQLKPVDRKLPEPELKPMLRVLAFLEVFPLTPAEQIDHQRPLTRQLEAGISEQYGQYLAVSCTGCHGEDLKGGAAPAPGMPPRPDITATGKPGTWTEAQFMQALRTGKTPEGKQLNQKDMPWQMTAHYTDLEIKALYKYLKSL